MTEFSLYNGVKMPAIGIGPAGLPCYKPVAQRIALVPSLVGRVWDKFVGRNLAKQDYTKAIANAVRVGFRLVDFAAAYGDAGLIRDAIEMSGVSCSDVLLTGRISNNAQFEGVGAVRNQIDRLLFEYQTNRLDLLMFHWPVTGCFERTWKVICEAYDSGKARSIGVANCHSHHLEAIMKTGMKPMFNQIEVHPLFTQKSLIEYCKEREILVESYTPIARMDSRLMSRASLVEIANAHNKTPVQIVLRWHVQNGCLPIVRSLNSSRQRENISIFDFELSHDEMQTIDGFNINSRLRYDPDNCDFTML